MDFDELRPETPKKDDKLFEGNRENWPMNAVLRPADGYAYLQGYRLAGRVLTEWAAENRSVDLLVYPICHSYRHYVELALKHLIPLGCNISATQLSESEARQLTTSHNLLKLWYLFKKVELAVIKETKDEPRPLEDMQGMEAYIKQLDALDTGSYSFRYAVKPTGEASIDIGYINLAQFSTYMERLCDYLEGFATYYGYVIDMQNEMYADCDPGDVYGDLY